MLHAANLFKSGVYICSYMTYCRMVIDSLPWSGVLRAYED
jgi:hypothetical protein